MDNDCISSLYTYEHMHQMCIDPNISVLNLHDDLDKNEQNKSVIIDVERIRQLPFTFSIAHLLPKCRHNSSMTFNLFTRREDIDNGMFMLF